MGKNFRTIEELVSLLESRGVKTDASTADAIRRESYYAIVNGYKRPFLDLEAMEKSNDDVYLDGTEFQHIYDLFMFDRDLRSLTFRYLTRAEAIMRTAVAYSFCHNHPERDAYLTRSNFCEGRDYLVPRSFRGDIISLHSKNMNDLMERLNGKLVIKRGTRDFIRHYLNVHGTVPLWVLANDLTFGNIVHFYQLMQVNDRREVCTTIAKVSRRDSKRDGFLSERDLLRAANLLNNYRNLCAHDERLYCTKFENDDFSTMVFKMTQIIPIVEVQSFINEIGDLFHRYDGRLKNVTPGSLLAYMGFQIQQNGYGNK